MLQPGEELRSYLVQSGIEHSNLRESNERMVGVGVLEKSKAVSTVKSCSILEHGDTQHARRAQRLLRLVDRRDGDVCLSRCLASLVG